MNTMRSIALVVVFIGVNDVTAGGAADLVVLDNVIDGEPRAAF